ncbi:CPBP family intramembrane glutamic endopeptidase [Microbacterium sp.]|uniref:CPBP family intramembrane glutamic endopeptidase n=1 Tax=Microbacterium sp. TaxID=51671 RepID=UPI003A877E1D
MTSAAAVPHQPPATGSSPRVASLPADAHTGLAFHRLVFARRRHAWWSPLLVGVLGVLLFVGLAVVIVVIVALISLADPGILAALTRFAQSPRIDIADPVMLAMVLGSIALMLPAYVLASRIVHGARVGLVSSAAGRLRWGWLVRCGLLALAVYTVVEGLALLLPGSSGAGPGVAAWGWSLLVVIVLVPIQAAAEEYVFRGYLMQLIGRWLRHPLWAILLPVPLFVVGHLYDLPGQISVGIFAVAAAWLSWRTGGLEAAIGLHVVNNLVVFATGLSGLTDVPASGTTVVGLVLSTAAVGGYVALIEWVFPRQRMPRVLVLVPPGSTAVGDGR